MLETWWHLTQSGAWAFNADGTGDWVIDHDKMPPDLLEAGIFH
jgi:hypothetical protein